MAAFEAPAVPAPVTFPPEQRAVSVGLPRVRYLDKPTQGPPPPRPPNRVFEPMAEVPQGKRTKRAKEKGDSWVPLTSIEKDRPVDALIKEKLFLNQRTERYGMDRMVDWGMGQERRHVWEAEEHHIKAHEKKHQRPLKQPSQRPRSTRRTTSAKGKQKQGLRSCQIAVNRDYPGREEADKTKRKYRHRARRV
jgi:hypothetical protein